MRRTLTVRDIVKLSRNHCAHKIFASALWCATYYSRRMAFCEHAYGKMDFIDKGAATKWLNKVIIVGV